MDDLIGDEPQYKVVQVSGMRARVEVYHERAIVFKAITDKGILKDSRVVLDFVVGSDRDGRITNEMIHKAKSMALTAMNGIRRKSKLYKT